MTAPWMLYGATGYTGQLILEEAVRRGLRPIVAGRNEEKIQALARDYGLDWQVFDVDDRAAVDAALADVDLVLSVAGPFSATARQMIDAAIANHTHYLDVTGEIAVFELAASLDNKAGAAGVMLMPGVGFDVVPSDCLAAHLKQRLPTATALTLAISGQAGASRGTAKTAIEGLGRGTQIRRGGAIVTVKNAPARDIDFGSGPAASVAVSWGDVATAWYTTAIPDITVYFEASGPLKQMVDASRRFGWLLRWKWVQKQIKARIDAMPPGPDEEARAGSPTLIFGEVSDETGKTITTRLRTSNGYTLTAWTAVEIATRVLGGAAVAGYQTPAQVFGPDFILDVPECSREDL